MSATDPVPTPVPAGRLCADLEPLKTMCDRATPGPWGWADSYTMTYGYPPLLFSHSRSVYDRHFIAIARTALPELIAEVQRLRDEVAGYAAGFDTQHAEIERLRAALRTLVDAVQYEDLHESDGVSEGLWAAVNDAIAVLNPANPAPTQEG